MRKVFMILGLFVSGWVAAQCNYTENEYNGFIKGKVVQTKARIVIYSAGNDALQFRAEGDRFYIDLSGSMPRRGDLIQQGAKLEILLDNDSVITAHAVKEASARRQNAGGAPVMYMDCRYEIARGQLAQLRDKKIMALRIHFAEMIDDVDLAKAVKQDKVQKAVNCLFTALEG